MYLLCMLRFLFWLISFVHDYDYVAKTQYLATLMSVTANWIKSICIHVVYSVHVFRKAVFSVEWSRLWPSTTGSAWYRSFLVPEKTTTHLIQTKYIVIHQHLINWYIICDPNASLCHSINCLELNYIVFNEKPTIQLYFQQPTSPENTRQTVSTGTDMHALDSDCLTELNITRLNDRTPPSTVTYRVETKLLKHIHDILSSSQNREQLQADEEDCRNSWMMVAMVIDRLLLLVFTLLAIVTSSVLLLNRPTYGDGQVSQILDTLGWSRMWHSL